jgi:hypothetical protein
MKSFLNKTKYLSILLIASALLFSGCAETSENDSTASTSTSSTSTSSDNTSSTSTLSAPSGVTATGGSQQVVLDWTAVSGASSYTVYWDNASGITSSDTAITSITTDNYTHSGLDNGTLNYYKVAAVNSAGTGTLSSEVSATTLALLAAPDNVSASGAGDNITLSWSAVSGASSYTVYWDNASGITSSDTAITSISTDNYTHTSLSDGTYYYKVAAVNAIGTGALSDEFNSILASNIQGAETNAGHTYALTSTTMSWTAAKAAASALGGYLATINTHAENTWLYEKFGNYGGTARDLWLGANDLDTEGTWIWDNGTTSGDGGVSDNISTGSLWPDGTSKWGSGEPNGSTSESCGTIRGLLSSELWNDLSCSSSLYGIIEID